MPTKAQINEKQAELLKNPQYSLDFRGGRSLNAEGQRALEEFKKYGGASSIGASEVTKLTNNYNARVKDYNTEIANRLKETNLDFTNRIKDTQTDYQNRIRDLQKEFAQRTKDEDAELRSIRNSKERAEKQKEFNESRKNRAAELAAIQREMSTRIGELQKEQKTAITNINNEKTTTLKDLATAFNETKAYIPQALGRGDTPTLDLITNKQRKEIQDRQAAEARAAAEARTAAEAQAKAQAEAAQQAQMQQYAQEAAQIAQQRKSQNYAQMYNLLTSNMPIPVGYNQPATSQQARTTMIGAGGEDQMPIRQMSPAQIAQMSTMQRGQGIMPQGVPISPDAMRQLLQQQAVQQQTQQMQQIPQAAQPAKRGGIMGKF